MMMTQPRKQSRKRVDTQKKNGPMQRGQQKIKLLMNKPRGVLPPFPLPYPPQVQLQKMVAKLASKPKLARFPNAFIMYRNEYVQFLKAKGLHLSMTELSPMIAAAWRQEPEYVKDAYTRLSGDAEKLYVRMAANVQPEIKYKFPAQRHPTFNDYTNEESTTTIIQRKENERSNDNVIKFGNSFASEYSHLLHSSSIPDLKGFPRDVNNDSNSRTFLDRSSSTYDGRDLSVINATMNAQNFDPSYMKQENCFIQEAPYIPYSQIPNLSPSSSRSSSTDSLLCGEIRFPSSEELILGSLPSPALTTPCSEISFPFSSPPCINCSRHYYDQQNFTASFDNESSPVQSSDFYPLSPVSPTLTFDESPMQSPTFNDFDITTDLYYVIDSALSFDPYGIPTSRSV
ncbi:1495_t:CDS:1 [Dentiscutata erythropus]|uniref:1495_t:CDS:1 n=1 Tax=Dentiscutata erythropus TaxID=1348616 RepID=A0A9N9B6V9_9GLOM|nr:1495_t:CDS:1 [Dentiscutata erythropus]